MYRVLVVEDNAFEKIAIVNLISLMEDYKVVETLENSEMAEIMCLRVPFDLIIMDVCTLDNSSGLKSAAAIKKLHPNIKVIISTSMPDFTFIDKARRAGCESFWYKNGENTDELKDIIVRTMNGESIYPDSTPIIKIGNATSDEFTPRELEVLKMIAEGKTYQEIADALYISIDTVRQHTKSIYSKTGLHSNTQLLSACLMSKLALAGY